MVDVQHSLLTGASLHEPKGVASAAANRVYVSNGLGSGNWSQVPSAALQPDTQAFQSAMFHCVQRENQGVGGGTSIVGTQARLLNTVLVNQIAGASLTPGQVFLPAGTYWCQGWAVGHRVNQHKVYINNASDNAILIHGSSAQSIRGDGVGDQISMPTISVVSGRFTINAVKAIELRHKTDQAQTGDGLGLPAVFGDEIYASLTIWKVG